MPFTLAHPAAVLPLVRHPFSAAALVAGAVAPDMPYFVRSAPIPVSAQSWYEPFLNATTSHGLLGAVTVDLPYALVLCGFYWMARRPVGALLPALAGSEPRTAGSVSTLLSRGGWVLLTLLIGIATHLAWDSFTHSDGYIVTHGPLLSTSLAGDLTWARALQHLSTIGGLVAITIYLWRRRHAEYAAGRGSAAQHRTLGALWVLGGAVAAGAVANALRWWARAEHPTTTQVIEGVLSDGAKGAGAALVGALFLYTAAWWAHRGVTTWRHSGRRSTSTT